MTTHEDAAITDAPYSPHLPAEPSGSSATPPGMPPVPPTSPPTNQPMPPAGRRRKGAPAPVDLVKGGATADQARGDGPSWWHRGHPVFTPLAGFFTGLLVVIVLPLSFAAILTALLPDDKVTGLLPVGLVVLVIPLVLLVPKGTRRFGRYMLIGMLATAVVIAASAALTLWILYSRDG